MEVGKVDSGQVYNVASTPSDLSIALLVPALQSSGRCDTLVSWKHFHEDVPGSWEAPFDLFLFNPIFPVVSIALLHVVWGYPLKEPVT